VPDYADVLGQGDRYFGRDKPCTCSHTRTMRFWDPTVVLAHISTHSVIFAFGPKSGFRNKCRAPAGFGVVISGSGLQNEAGLQLCAVAHFVLEGERPEKGRNSNLRGRACSSFPAVDCLVGN